MPIDQALLSMLVCPACDDRPPLREEGANLICDECHRVYPVRDGILILLPEEATIPDTTAHSE